ncbi:hypothetical protein UNSW3_1435 [Campylobacter concisus UNSW3]|uniref:Uncharacterized protein n=1 Tax=Campylobacter concisus UNSW3 TaxID=1242966 RepID=U2EWB6_9BACT|nr:hypothetical protein UNSW3_1435 [Campylobacter concisus UNSW3]
MSLVQNLEQNSITQIAIVTLNLLERASKSYRLRWLEVTN